MANLVTDLFRLDHKARAGSSTHNPNTWAGHGGGAREIQEIKATLTYTKMSQRHQKKIGCQCQGHHVHVFHCQPCLRLLLQSLKSPHFCSICYIGLIFYHIETAIIQQISKNIILKKMKHNMLLRNQHFLNCVDLQTHSV